jgi:tRNA(fMet)-specific endonuclease VapC
MPYLLDSNVWITLLRARDPVLALRVKSLPPAEVYSCAVVRAELLYGAHKSAASAANVALVHRLLDVHPSPAFDDDAAAQYAKIRADLESKGQTIGANDYCIAAIALARGLTLVTRNTREFSRVPNLIVEDWQTP